MEIQTREAVMLPIHQHEDLDIEQIIIGDRYRKELGDIARLAESIQELGLLQPVVVTNENVLVAGERRIRAFQSLGWSRIPVRRVNIGSIVRGEYDENEVRENFRPSEQVAIAMAVAKSIPERRGGDTSSGEQRNPQNIAECKGAETRDIAATKAGFGNRETYRQAKYVVETEDQELIEAMDSGKLSISAAASAVPLAPAVRKEIIAAADPKAELRRAVLEAVSSKTSAPSNRNPLYRPNEMFKALASVSGHCDSISQKIEDLGADQIVAGAIDQAMREREMATIRRCINNLNSILETFNA